MNPLIRPIRRLLLLAGLLFSLACQAESFAFLNAADLALNRQRLAQHNAPGLTLTAWQQLQHEADKALKQPLLSVTDKRLTPPGGTKHDYLSLGAYWWPDPEKADGLPWRQRDGQVNPASKNDDSDGVRLATFTSRVQVLTLAWYFSGDTRYATRATELIRHWFIDPASRMNPNLNFAQGVPGIAPGRHTGVLDGRYFATRLVDALVMLRQAPGWQAADERQMRRWLSDYLDWLLTSKRALGEAAAKNNHGSWYSTQVAGIAWYLQRPEIVREMVSQARQRLNGQLAADGSQPLELARTRSFHYSWFNLQALTALAGLAARSGNGDLWQSSAAGQPGLLSALDFMAPWSDAGRPWPYKNRDRIAVRLIPLLAQAADATGGDRYRREIGQADWTLPPAGAARGATQAALRETWLLSVPRFARAQPRPNDDKTP